MVRISIGGIYAIATLFFRQYRIQLHRVGNRCRSIHLAGTASPPTSRSVAASAHPAQFRFLGLAFLVPGVVSPDLPSAYAQSAAYGDIIAAVLALLTLISLHSAFRRYHRMDLQFLGRSRSR